MEDIYTLEELIKKHVSGASPVSGNVLGNTLMATALIRGRYYNDGDELGRDSGKEIVNAAARYLAANADDYPLLKSLEALVRSANYGDDLEELSEDVAHYVNENLEELLETADPMKSWTEYRTPGDDVSCPRQKDYDMHDECSIDDYIDALGRWRDEGGLDLFCFSGLSCADDMM